MSLKYEIYNGKKIVSGSLLFDASNRAFRYGDGLFETIKVSDGIPRFFSDHLERLENGLRLLHFNSFGIIEEIEKGIFDFINLSEHANLRIRLIVFRESTGFYTPDTDKISWHLSGEVIATSRFQYVPEGIKAGLYSENAKSKSRISTVKTLNCLVSVIAGIHARDRGWNDALILNCDGNIIEATSSNLFIRKGNLITTPPLSDGCLDGVMRKNVVKILNQLQFDLEERSLTLKETENADEMLVTNAIAGVRWIEWFQEKRLENTLAEKIISILNN